MSGDYASSGYLDDEPAAFARFPLAFSRWVRERHRC
jgi:hypothetical protein